MLSSGNRKTA